MAVSLTVPECNVSSSLGLFNNTRVPGDFLAFHGGSPDGAAYGSGTGQIFVATSRTNVVSVISDSSHRVVASIPGGPALDGLPYDPGGWRGRRHLGRIQPGGHDFRPDQPRHRQPYGWGRSKRDCVGQRDRLLLCLGHFARDAFGPLDRYPPICLRRGGSSFRRRLGGPVGERIILFHPLSTDRRRTAGTYSYAVLPVHGCVATPGKGNVLVQGNESNLGEFRFGPGPPAALLSAWEVSLVVGGTIVAIVLWAIFLFRKRRHPVPTEGSSEQ